MESGIRGEQSRWVWRVVSCAVHTLWLFGKSDESCTQTSEMPAARRLATSNLVSGMSTGSQGAEDGHEKHGNLTYCYCASAGTALQSCSLHHTDLAVCRALAAWLAAQRGSTMLIAFTANDVLIWYVQLGSNPRNVGQSSSGSTWDCLGQGSHIQVLPLLGWPAAKYERPALKRACRSGCCVE